MVDGVVDVLAVACPYAVRVFGHSKAGTKLEASKAFAKDFLQEYDIPTAMYSFVCWYDVSVHFFMDCTCRNPQHFI